MRCPHRHATVTDAAPRIARAPQIAIDVGPHAVGSALDAVDHEIVEELAVRKLVVGTDVEDIHVAFAAAVRVAGSLTGADDIKLLVVRRETQSVRIGDLILTHDQIDLAALVDTVHARRQLALIAADLGRLPEPRIDSTGTVRGSASGVHCSLVELCPIRRVGEPVAAIRVGHDIVRRIETFAIELRRDDGHRAIELIAHDAAHQVLARDLPSLKVEGVAVAVVGRLAEDAHMAIIFQPAQLSVVGDIAPQQVAPLAAPGRPFCPQDRLAVHVAVP